MELFYFEVTRKSDGLKESFEIRRLKGFEEIDHTTKVYLDTKTIVIDELYQDFIKRLKKWQKI